MKSRAIHINFAPRTLRSAWAETPPWLLLLALLGVLMFGWALFTAGTVAGQLQTLDEAVQRSAKSESAGRAKPAPPFAIPEARALIINAVVGQLNIPWSDVFDAIENATPASIALVALEPDVKKQVVKGTAEARSSDDMIGYIELLKKQPLFVNVILLKHEVSLQDPYKPLRFEFEAQWQEGAP